MANADKPQGFELKDSEGKQFRTKKYAKSAAVLYPGDVVKANATGDVSVAAAGEVPVGVVLGYADAAEPDVLICDDPEAIFAVQVSNGSFALADVFQNIDLAAGTPDSLLKRSGMSADIGTLAATATLQFKIVGLEDREENEVGAFARILVKPNEHLFKAGTAGV